MTLRLAAVMAGALVALSGCASIVNKAGEQIHVGATPVTLTLMRGAGYFQPEVYTVSLGKDGYARKDLTIAGSLSGWYIGNILFGGLIGMLAVDPVTGAMYTFPDSVSGTLDASAKVSGAAPSLTIVSTESMTPEQMKRATLVSGR